MNHQHNRGDLHAIHNHAPGKSLVGPIYLNKGRRHFYMQCGFHAYMESWAMAVNNPYYVLTDENGKFSLEQVPPGTYQLVGLASADGSRHVEDGHREARRQSDRATLVAGAER